VGGGGIGTLESDGHGRSARPSRLASVAKVPVWNKSRDGPKKSAEKAAISPPTEGPVMAAQPEPVPGSLLAQTPSPILPLPTATLCRFQCFTTLTTSPTQNMATPIAVLDLPRASGCRSTRARPRGLAPWPLIEPGTYSEDLGNLEVPGT
jgi:hypothetical protein